MVVERYELFPYCLIVTTASWHYFQQLRASVLIVHLICVGAVISDR